MSLRMATWLKVYGIPMVIGVLTLAGLLSALLLGDAGRIFAWFALAAPLAIVARVILKTRAR